MSIKTHCPHCKKTFSLRDEMAGKRIKCPRCDKPYAVGQDEDGTPCPSCHAIIAQNGILCVNCGYNTQTGQKLKIASPPDLKKARRDFIDEETKSETKNVLIRCFVVVPGLSVLSAVIGGLMTRSMMAEKFVSRGPADLPIAMFAIPFSYAISNGWYLWIACHFDLWVVEGKNQQQRDSRRRLRWFLFGACFVGFILTIVVLFAILPAAAWEVDAATKKTK